MAQTLLLKCIVRPAVRITNSGVAEVAAFFFRSTVHGLIKYPKGDVLGDQLRLLQLA